MKSKNKAFTLVELLIALSILSIIAYLTASSFVSIRKATEWNSKNRDLRRGIMSVISNFDNELSSVIHISSNKRTLFKSKRRDLVDIKLNDLKFCYIDPVSYYELIKRDELVEVEYKIEQNENKEGKYQLRKKIWYLSTNPEKPEDRNPDADYILLDELDFFMMRFYLKGKWYDDWDTEKMNELPDMIELDFSTNGKEYREFFNVYISEL